MLTATAAMPHDNTHVSMPAAEAYTVIITAEAIMMHAVTHV